MDSAGIPWYSTGTVNVTQGSSNVAGVGTNWVNAGLKVGDIFTIDKSRLYQITAINSNTSLSLQEAYQGATGSSQVYFVIRNFAGTMQAQIAAQVSELVNKYESYIDTELKQITGPAGPTSFPYRGTWTTGRSYNGLDVVQYNNQLYMALYGHTSTSANAPGATGTAWTQLTFDAAFSATKAEIAAVANVGAKNIINLYSPDDGLTKTQNGITYTFNNDDMTFNVNGTSSNYAYYYLKSNIVIPKGRYLVSCAGAISGMHLTIKKDDNTEIIATGGQSAVLESAQDINVSRIYFYTPGNVTVNNITIYPMIRDAAIEDNTYVPYGMKNSEITKIINVIDDTPWLILENPKYNIVYRKKNGIVFFTTSGISAKTEIEAGNTEIGTIQEEYRPNTHIYIAGMLNDMSTPCRLSIAPSGLVVLRCDKNIPQGSLAYIIGSYPVVD